MNYGDIEILLVENYIADATLTICALAGIH
jgi:hypothetical protein